MTLESLCPSVFYSPHVKRNVTQDSSLIIIVKTFAQIFYLLTQKKKALGVYSNQVLFYSPNSKYDKFSSVLEKEFKDNCDVLSEKNYNSATIDPRDITSFSSNRFVVFKLFKEVIELRSIAKKGNELHQFKENYWLIFSLLRKDLFLSCLFINKQYKYFFSFHPVGDLHMLIMNFYEDQFRAKYAIRPTTTYFNAENKFIKTEYLFYKTERERKIYKRNINTSIKLLQAGLIMAESKDQANGSAIMFIDTCTNSNPQSSIIRRKAIEDFLEFAKQLKIYIYFKFHPGLLPKMIDETTELINKSKIPNLQIVDQIPFNKLKLCVSFDSTVMFECIEKGVLILNLTGEYNMLPSIDSEFADDSIPLIRNKSDFQQILSLLNDSDQFVKLLYFQKEWLKKSYNFPNGIKNIINALKEITI